MKAQKLNKKDLTKKGMIKLINRDLKDINDLSDDDLISIVSFFKFLCTDIQDDDGKAFLTNRNSIIGKFKKDLEKNGNIRILFVEEMIAG